MWMIPKTILELYNKALEDRIFYDVKLKLLVYI